MVSFRRMKDELDDLGTHVSSKIPAVGRTSCFVFLAVVVVVLFVVGFGIGYSAKHTAAGGYADGNSTYLELHSSELSSPTYVFVSNSSYSCPPLKGDRLLTTMEHGQSFEGLVVNLACRGDFNSFPNQVKCQRKSSFDGPDSLEWSHVPVCYPSVLVSQTHWSKTLHARSVSCTGDARKTTCVLSCVREYVAVETQPYECSRQPCPAWSLGDSRCFMCDQRCEDLQAVANPRADTLIDALGCHRSCHRVLVNSDGPAAVWQNKRTGLFLFWGEHNGRPLYQNNATKEFLFFTFTGSEWLVGPDFTKPHAGIQVYGNDDTHCPERAGGSNTSRLYIDSSGPSPGGTGQWTTDDTLDFRCIDDDYHTVNCACNTYKVYHLTYTNGSVPDAVRYLSGVFTKINEREYGLLAPLYYDQEKMLYLFSHHPRGRVWQVSTKLSTTPLRGVFPADDSCPDAGTVEWEWFNATTDAGQQVYVRDRNVQIKCMDPGSTNYTG